jgi:hypothetical protein
MIADFGRLLRSLEAGKVDFLIVGGIAASLHGSGRVTSDLDILYRRTRDNIERLASAVAPLKPYLRGAPPNLPFHFDAETIRRGLNFTLTTEAGPLDCLGEMAGVTDYETLARKAIQTEAHGVPCRVIDLDSLIAAKRAAGRPKDFEAVAELEIIREERER